MAGGAVRGVIEETELVFVTGNEGKRREVERILSVGSPFPFPIVKHSFDLPELQGTPEEVARLKVIEAQKHTTAPVFVEDTSLCYNALGGLPGVYIKWFLEAVGHDGLHRLLAGYEDKSAVAQCIFAFSTGPGAEPSVYVGRTPGRIVAPRGPPEFGWDPVFEPEEGGGKTYAEMDKADKDRISHRGRALALFKRDLESRAQDVADAVAAAAAAEEAGEDKP